MLCSSLILQRTTSLGYFKKTRSKEPLVLGISKTLRELFGFHERTTSFYSSRVGTMKILFGRSVLGVVGVS
jgi:hypothetical protein